MNSCYTYFRIVGDFDPSVIAKRLAIKPFESRKKGNPISAAMDMTTPLFLVAAMTTMIP